MTLWQTLNHSYVPQSTMVFSKYDVTFCLFDTKCALTKWKMWLSTSMLHLKMLWPNLLKYDISIGTTLTTYHRNRTEFVATNGSNYVIFCLITYRGASSGGRSAFKILHNYYNIVLKTVFKCLCRWWVEFPQHFASFVNFKKLPNNK